MFSAKTASPQRRRKPLVIPAYDVEVWVGHIYFRFDFGNYEARPSEPLVCAIWNDFLRVRHGNPDDNVIGTKAISSTACCSGDDQKTAIIGGDFQCHNLSPIEFNFDGFLCSEHLCGIDHQGNDTLLWFDLRMTKLALIFEKGFTALEGKFLR